MLHVSLPADEAQYEDLTGLKKPVRSGLAEFNARAVHLFVVW